MSSSPKHSTGWERQNHHNHWKHGRCRHRSPIVVLRFTRWQLETAHLMRVASHGISRRCCSVQECRIACLAGKRQFTRRSTEHQFQSCLSFLSHDLLLHLSYFLSHDLEIFRVPFQHLFLVLDTLNCRRRCSVHLQSTLKHWKCAAARWCCTCQSCRMNHCAYL